MKKCSFPRTDPIYVRAGICGNLVLEPRIVVVILEIIIHLNFGLELRLAQTDLQFFFIQMVELKAHKVAWE